MLAVIARGCRDQGKSRSDIFMKLEFVSSLVDSFYCRIDIDCPRYANAFRSAVTQVCFVITFVP